VGTIGMVVTAVSFALVPIVGAVLAIRFIQGLAWGLTNTSCSTIAADTIPKPRYAEGIGFFGLASSVAMIITPALSLAVFYAAGGEVSVLICAGFFMLSLLCSCFITYKKIDKPQKPAERAPRRSALEFIKHSLLERSALLAGLLMILTASSYGLVQTFVPTMLEGRAFEGIELFFIVMAVAAFVARPVFGRWADNRGYFEPGLLSFICTAASMIALAFGHDFFWLMIAALLQGIGYSTGFSLFMAMATVKAAPHRRGSAIATVMVGFDIGSGLTAMIFGFVAFAIGYEAIFICGAVIAAVGIIVLLLRRSAVAAAS
jgi:MFS family permease